MVQPLQLSAHPAHTTVPPGGMQRCHWETHTKKTIWLARELLSEQTGQGCPTVWRYHCLTLGLGSGKQQKLHPCQTLPELSPRARASNMAWPPHTADHHMSPWVLTVKFWIIGAALGCSWAGAEGRTHCQEGKEHPRS